MATTRRYTIWVDANGATRLTYLTGNATLSSILTQLVALSNADSLNWTEGTLTAGSASPPGNTYRSVWDSALLTFTDGAGNLTDITLPAPLTSVFKADQETVDPTAITALISAVVGTAVTNAGGVVTAYVAGTRVPKKVGGT